MTVTKDDLNNVVMAYSGPNGENRAIGRMVGYADHPTAIIETEDGEKISWAAHMCSCLSDAAASEYWRKRCERLEELGHGRLPEFLTKPSSLTAFGQMNRALRRYYEILMRHQAEYLGLGSAQLSGYETGREPIPDHVLRDVHEYWAERLQGPV